MRFLLLIALLGFVAVAVGQESVAVAAVDDASEELDVIEDPSVADYEEEDDESSDDEDEDEEDDDDDEDEEEEDDDDDDDNVTQVIQNDEIDESVNAAVVPTDVEQIAEPTEVKTPTPSKSHKGKRGHKGHKVSKERAQQILGALGWKKFKQDKNIAKLLSRH